MARKDWENRRASCQKCRHERYMHEYENALAVYVLGPCKSEPREGVEPKLAHLCGCTHTRFEAVPVGISHGERGS